MYTTFEMTSAARSDSPLDVALIVLGRLGAGTDGALGALRAGEAEATANHVGSTEKNQPLAMAAPLGADVVGAFRKSAWLYVNAATPDEYDCVRPEQLTTLPAHFSSQFVSA
ncbi:hypothetical protein [uncultured Microbacterium sp.]|uniref:hypothetical protein n=1 Tax=uncultured Microbacterium sp. TaxID=191216 RepID=UPI0025D8D085|nr:hypothetical protein [uncultured Microbacterium sp.]